MTSRLPDDIRRFTARIASTVEDNWRDLRPTGVQATEGRDVVSREDVLLERHLSSMIAAHFPDHSIVAEEQSSVAREGRFSWILDPIEGTVNFSTGFPIYGTSLALHDGETLLWSYVYLPSIRRRYSAILGEGAYCNGDRIRVASRSRLADSLATVMLTSHFSAAETEVACTVVRKLNMQLRGVRVLACSAAELSLLAHGAVDAVVCTKADVTGIAAGQLLVEEAGGRVSELGGAPIGLHSATMLATNGLIHEQICAALS